MKIFTRLKSQVIAGCCFLIVLISLGQRSTAQSITNYSFAASSGTFTALSGATTATGTGSTVDEGHWNGIPIGFDFWYMGTRYTTVSPSTNGWLTLGANITDPTYLNNLSSGGAPRPILAPLWDDLNIQSAANASYLTSGTAGSRIFTVQFLNYKWDHSATGNTISFQVKLYEATGKIQYIYRPESGSVNAGSASIGIAATATGSGNFLSLNGTGASPSVSSTAETNTLSTRPASGQTYSFTPLVPTAPTSLTFTSVTSSAITLNWVDNSSNESGFVIYRSTDGVNYSFVSQTTAGSTSSAQTGLSEITTYYWKVYAVTEGGLSTALSGTQATLCAYPTIAGTPTPSCVGSNTGTITASSSGGSSPYTYSLNGGTYQSSVTFSGLAAGTYTLAVKSNTGCVNSTSVVVSEYATSTDNQNATGTNSWIGHMYDGTGFTNYIGQFTETETFNELFGGSYNCFSVVSNAVTSSIYTETFSVKYKMNSTKRGLYIVNLGSDDGSRMTVDGTMVYNNWNDQGFSTKSNVLMNLTGTSALLYEFYENGGGNQVIFQSLTQVLANTLSTNTTQNICSGLTPLAISGDTYGTLPSGISVSGTGYQWTYSTTLGGARTNIAGATGATFTPSISVAPFNAAGTYYVYRNALLSSTNNVSPNPYTATNESNAATIIIGASSTISYTGSPYCSTAGTATVTLTGTTGGSYSAAAGLSINSTTGDVTLATSTAGTYTVTYTIAASGPCPLYTTTTSITINATPSAPTVTSPVNYCQNATATQLTATGTGLLWNGLPGTVGGTATLTTATYVDNSFNNKRTNFTTASTNVVINTIDYFIPAYQSVSGLVLSIYNSSGTVIATSSTSTTATAGASATKITSTFNYNITTAGNYSIGVSAGSGNIGSDNPGFSITEVSGTISITGVTSAGYRCFNNIVFTPATSAVAPTPVTAVAGSSSYAVTQTVAGCVSTAATITVVVAASPSISQIPVSNLIANYKFEGNANDATGNNNGTLQNAPSLTTDRFGNANKAYSFNGSTQYISTARQYVNPTNFSMSIWFKTNSTTGGKLIGFGNVQTTVSSVYDRHLYMNNAGQIYFGVYPTTVRTVNSPLAYNDNNWHLATATLSSSAGMVLYVDGVQVGSDPTTTLAEISTGYWKIGYDNLNGWTSSPTSFFFNGSLDDALIYQTALSASDVLTLYTSPDGAGNNGPVCTGSSVSLSATTVSGASYAWTGPASFTSSSQNPSFTYAAANAGTYTLVVTVAGCNATAYTNVKSSTNAGQWTGNTSTDWSDATNWCSGIVPTSSTNVTIPSGATRMPSIITSVVCNNLTINTGATLITTLAGTLNIAGTLTNSGTITNSGTTNFNGTSGQQTFSGISSFYNLTLNNSSGLLLPAAITINNNLTLTAGIFNANNFNVAVNGNWVNNVSTSAFTAGTATVTFSGSAAQLISGTAATTFNNLIAANTANTVSLNTNISIAGNLTVSSGTLDLLSFTANRATAGGTLTVSNNAVLKIGGTNTYPTNYTTNTLVVASTVEYAGTNQTVANQSYGNLKLSSSTGAVVKTFPATALTVVGNLSSVLGSGTSVTFTAASNITVNGNVSIGASTTFNGSSYSNSIGGNWDNSGTFNGNTGTVTLTGTGATVSGSGAQNFNNLTVAAASVSFSNSSISLSGNLATTGAGSFNQASGGTLTMTGASKTISGSGISLDNLTVSGSVTTAVSLTLTGNLSVSGTFTASANTITLSGASKTISGAGTKSFSVLAVSGSITTAVDFTITSGLTVSGSLTASAGNATFTGTSTLSGTANLFTTTINGTSLQLSANSILGIANVLTITAGTLNVTSSTPNTVNFNSSGAQNINAITYDNLTLSNGNTKTATAGLTVNNSITIAASTTFVPGTYIHSIYNNWNNYGTFTAGSSTVQFLGSQNSTITGATTFNILTVNNATSATGVILQNNVSAATINMTQGTMLTGTNTITITTTRTGNGIILGNITRNHSFAALTAYAFEGPDNTITFTIPVAINSVTVSVTKGAISDFPNGSSISRVYDISIPSGTYVFAKLRLHYEDDELNGNNESTMSLWNYSGSSWGVSGKTANSTTSNYVEQSLLLSTTNRWTCAYTQSVVQWNGSVSTDWNTAANWTVTQGSGSRPPAATDIVNLGTGAFTYNPTISNAVTVKNINFGSTQALTLTMASGGSLTAGSIQGAWSSNKTHTINANNQTITVNGDMSLSDGTSGHAINLNIGTGTVAVAGSLTQSGGANIVFSGAGNLNIAVDYNYVNGTFTPSSGTVTYSGVTNQAIGAVTYNNLTINKAAAIAAINSALTIGGNLTVTAGELDNSSTATIAGNVTIASGATLANYNILHVGGNWANNGTYSGTGVNVIFDGSGTQTISATTFNNLEFNKPVGSVASLTGAVTLKGNLVGTSGTLDIGSYFFNRDVVGGSATMANAATLIIAADNAPNKFASYYLASGSTVIFNGTTTQHLLLPGLVYGNLIFRNSGSKILYTATTVAGDLTIESGATFDAGANTITLNGNWVNSGAFTPSTSTIVCTGASKNITGTTTFNQLTVPGTYTFLNDMTLNSLLNITNTGSLSGGSTITVTMNGDLLNSGTLYNLGTTTFTGNVLQTLSLINAVQTVAITVNFNGTVSPVLNSTSAPQYGYLNINNTGGINPSVGWTVLYALTVGSGASFNGGNSTHTIFGSLTNSGTITSSGILNFTPSSAKTLNFGSNFSSTGLVNFGGAGAITLAGTPTSFNNIVVSNTNAAGVTPSSVWGMTNNLTVNSGSILNAASYTHLVGGNIVNNGTINRGTSTFTLNGTAAQDIYSASAFNNLTINKASGATTLSYNATVNGVLNFVAGKIQTGAYSVVQPSGGTVTGAAQNTGWINGYLQKNIATGATAKTFEIGSAVSYTPMSLAFASVTTAGNLTASTTTGDHPNISSSTISASRSLNRYYTLTNSGIVFTNYTATYNFVAGDVDAGASTAAFNVEINNGSSWTVPVTASPNATNIQATGVTLCGDFAIGEICNRGTTIVYAGTPYCSNAGTATVSLTGATGGSFSSGAGLSINATTGAINLSASTPGTYSVIYTIAASGDCGQYITSTPVTVGTQGMWTGTVSTDWNNAANWSCSGVGVFDITIPSGAANYPVIAGTIAIHDITIQGGASVTVTGGTLQIAGAIANSGTLNASAGTIQMNGSSSQTIPANVFVNNNILNLIIGNNTTLAGPQNVTGAVSFSGSSKTLTTGGYLTLKSTAAGTARLADITNNGTVSGNTVSGNVTIERHIPARRAWRLLSAPVCACSAPTINASWQEGATSGNPYPGYGTQITGGATVNGFDQGVNSNAAIKYYNTTTGSFAGLPISPGTNTAITTYPGYFLFMRGDRSTNLAQGIYAALSPTTLRIRGQVNTGNIPVTINAAGYTLVGNPYPAAIDFHTLTKSNVNDKFYLWDPKMAGTSGVGGYVTLLWNSATSSYDATTSVSAVSRYIPSGEAFLVESINGVSTGTLTIKETDKNNSGSDYLFRPVYGNERMRINLLAVNADGSSSLSDGVLTTYDNNNANAVDNNDAKKLYNIAENIGIAREGKNLAIERRQTIDGNDTTFLNVYTLKKQNYKLQITTDAMENSGLNAVLKDNYSAVLNNTALNMNGVTDVVFTVNADAASYAVDRFSIVFAKQGTVPVTFTSVKAHRQQNDIVVDWKTANELNIQSYEVQVSATGSGFTKAATVAAKTSNGGSAGYTWLDANATEGIHYYRIKSTDISGKEKYSTVVSVTVGKVAGTIVVYPNPVTDGVMGLQFSNMPAGQYKTRLLNSFGQLVLVKTINHNSGNAIEKIALSNEMAKGIYSLEITNPDNNKTTIGIVYQ